MCLNGLISIPRWLCSLDTGDREFLKEIAYPGLRVRSVHGRLLHETTGWKSCPRYQRSTGGKPTSRSTLRTTSKTKED